MKLTKNFSLSEFLKAGDEAYLKERGLWDFVVENLYRLAVLLEKVREDRVIITSGFRTPERNKEVGGSETSLHLLGMACDVIGGVSIKGLVELLKTGEIGELIVYGKRGDRSYMRLHIGLPSLTRNCFGKFLVAFEGERNYRAVNPEVWLQGLNKKVV